jgi:hypothetical protein
MQTLKKFTATFISLLFLAPSFAQEKGDLGLIISTSRYNKLALEYRKPFAEKYHFRLAATYGEIGNPFWYNQGQIIHVSDSIVVARSFYKNGYQTGLRFGVERQLKNSMFSVGTDLSVDYRQSRSTYRSRISYLQDDGSWEEGLPTTVFENFDDPSNSRITRHYLVAGARLSLNMNIPLGKSFLLNLAASGTYGLPIYMGATRIQDPLDDFIGTPPSITEFDTRFSIGLRYIFGSRNKEKG